MYFNHHVMTKAKMKFYEDTAMFFCYVNFLFASMEDKTSPIGIYSQRKESALFSSESK